MLRTLEHALGRCHVVNAGAPILGDDGGAPRCAAAAWVVPEIGAFAGRRAIVAGMPNASAMARLFSSSAALPVSSQMVNGKSASGMSPPCKSISASAWRMARSVRWYAIRSLKVPSTFPGKTRLGLRLSIGDT
jgi:hypothetical protein